MDYILESKHHLLHHYKHAYIHQISINNNDIYITTVSSALETNVFQINDQSKHSIRLIGSH